MAKSRRERGRVTWLGWLALGLGAVFLLHFSPVKAPFPAGAGAETQPIPANLFSVPKKDRCGKKFQGVVEIGDAFPVDPRGGRVVSAWLETEGEKVPAGLQIPASILPPGLQKGQRYRCRLVVNGSGFLEVEGLEKD